MAQVPSAAQVAYDAIKAVTLSTPISLDELRDILMHELSSPVNPEQPAPCTVPEAIHFENIYDFSSWYSSNQHGFSSLQQVALDTILQTRQLIEVGCACKRASRENMAHQYFNTFWTQNRKTDLLATIAKVTKAKKVSIGAICAYPMTPEMPC